MLVAALVFGTVLPVARLPLPGAAERVDRRPPRDRAQPGRDPAGVRTRQETSRRRSTARAGAAPTTTSVARARRSAQIRLLDPNKLTPTFNVKQEIQAFYQFKTPLDIAHYPLGGARPGRRDRRPRAQPLRASRAAPGRNNHLIYTHGYGVVAAPTNRLNKNGDADLRQRRPPAEEPDPGRRAADLLRPALAVVLHRRSAPGQHQERRVRPPEHQRRSTGVHSTYQGKGGVPIGSRLTRLLYAVKLGDPNIFFSSGINSGSQLLTRARPPQPRRQGRAVADPRRRRLPGPRRRHGRSGSSTATRRPRHYPNSQRLNLHQATANSLTNATGIAQPAEHSRSTTCTTR